MDEPRLILIGGANGSGKTTLAREYISVERLPYLGADQIAYELNPENVESVAIEAGRLFIHKIAESIERRQSFIVESTLSGLSLKKWVGKARENGYNVTVLFVYLDSPQICIERVALRVVKGGHLVPDKDIIRRYERSNHNFWNSYKSLANEWSLFNNGDSGIIQVAASTDQGYTVLDKERFEIWQEMVMK